ncbi:PAS domain-containing sensor histidine kinase, partial [Stenotrophomonas sp. KAs 5-3]
MHYIGAMSDPAPPPSLDALGTPLAWAGADGCIAGCNPAFARWLGVSVRRLLGRPLAALEVQGEVWLNANRTAWANPADAAGSSRAI